MLFTSQGQSVLGKTVPSVLCTVSKTSGTVFPNTDLPSSEQHIFLSRSWVSSFHHPQNLTLDEIDERIRSLLHSLSMEISSWLNLMQKYHRRIISSLYWVLSWIKSRSRVRHLGACGQMKHMTIVKDWMAERETLNCHYFGSNCLPMTFSARECRKEAWKKTNINIRSQKDFPLFAR